MHNYLRTAFYLARMTRRAYWDRERLTKYRTRKLRRILSYAYANVPFYHRTFEHSGLRLSEIKTIKDLNRLPIIRKEEIRKNADEMLSNQCNVNKLRKISTSGSTGMPLSILLSQKEDEIRKVAHLRANISCGQRPRDQWVVVTPPVHHHEVPRLLQLLHVYSFTPLSVFDDPEKQIARLRKLKPDVLEGYSTSLLLMAKKLEERNAPEFKLRFLIGGAELTDNSSRQFVEKVFNAPFYDQYSSTEFGRMAWQCSEKNGYHIDDDMIIMQFIDKNGEEVAPGERGEIVCTSLSNYAMPIIRYVLGDLGVLSEEADCPCGRTFPLMKVIEGRKDSILVLPDGRELSPLVVGDGMMYFKHFCDIDQYRVIQEKVDSFKVLVKRKGSNVAEADMAAELGSHFAKLLGVDKSQVTIEVEFLDEIPLDETGKLMKVVSKVRSSAARIAAAESNE